MTKTYELTKNLNNVCVHSDEYHNNMNNMPNRNTVCLTQSVHMSDIMSSKEKKVSTAGQSIFIFIKFLPKSGVKNGIEVTYLVKSVYHLATNIFAKLLYQERSYF